MERERSQHLPDDVRQRQRLIANGLRKDAERLAQCASREQIEEAAQRAENRAHVLRELAQQAR